MRNAIVLMILALAAFQACGAALHVDRDARSRMPDGGTWARAFPHPQDAIDVAQSGDEIWVAKGTYHRRYPQDRVLVTLREGVALLGGFAGTEAVRTGRDPQIYESILDGEDFTYHVVIGAAYAEIDGFTITGGRAVGPAAADRDGAGIYNYELLGLEVRQCRFTGCSAASAGGAVRNIRSHVYIENCTLSANSAQWGGAVSDTQSYTTMIGCRLTGNIATFTGGACYAYYYSYPHFHNCIFNDNEASSGGAICETYGSYMHAINCTIVSNNADSGGGVNGRCHLRSTILWGNAAPVGPQVYVVSSNVNIRYCDIQGGFPGENIIDLDPLFVSPTEKDFRLTPGSPCIDHGDSRVAESFDHDGWSRYDDPLSPNIGTGNPPFIDIGAHEYQGLMRVQRPNGGEELQVGKEYRIDWTTAYDSIETVQIELSRDGGETWKVIPGGTEVPNTGSYVWRATGSPATSCLIRISDAEVASTYDECDACFSILAGRHPVP